MKLHNLIENTTNFPMGQEVAWIDGGPNKYQFGSSKPSGSALSDTNRILGTKDKVHFKYNKNDVKGKYICHTHPTANKDDNLNAYPSKEDLQAAGKLKKDGAVGIKIYGDSDRVMTIIPKNSNNTSRFKEYENALRNGDFNNANKKLKMMGFDAILDEI